MADTSAYLLLCSPPPSLSLTLCPFQFYNKESRAKLYPASAYFLANTLLEVSLRPIGRT